MDRIFIFVTAFLCGGVVLLTAVVILCIFVQRLKKQVKNLATPVYTEAFHDLKKKPNKRKKNVYQIGRSPKPRRQQSTLYRNDSDESITFVPSGNEEEVCGPSANSRSDCNGNNNSSLAVESIELKTFAAVHNSGQIDEELNIGKTNEAFASERGPQLNSPCQGDAQKRPESTINVTAWEKRSRGESARHSSNSVGLAVSRHSHSSEQIVDLSKPNPDLSSKPEDNTHVQFTKHLERRGLLVVDNSGTDPSTQAIDGEEQVYSNQETDAMAEIDKVIQAHNTEPERIQNTEKEMLEPVYVNVGALAQANNPEVHLITGQNMPWEPQSLLATQAIDCSQQSNENQNYVTAQIGDHDEQTEYNGQNTYPDYNGQNGYQDYSGQNENEDFSGKNGYQDYSGQYEYQDFSGQNEYQDFSGQNEYQDFSGQNEYLDFSSQNGYQDYNGQSGYQDLNGQSGYQDFNGQSGYQDYNADQNGYQVFNDQNELVNPEEGEYYGNLNQNGNANGLQLEEGENHFQDRYQPLHRQSGEHFNQGFQEEDETEHIYDNPAEGEVDDFYVNPDF